MELMNNTELISKLKETDYKKLHLKDTFFIGYCI